MNRAALILLVLLAPIASAATSLEVVVPPTTTTAVPFDFTVTAKNGASVDTAYAGTIHFTSNEATATLPSDYTFVPADNGTHTFSATFNRSDDTNSHKTFLLTARDGSNNTITGSDVSDVFWNASVVRDLILDVMGAVTRTVPYDLTVTALNAYGAVITSYTGTVHFKSTQGLVEPADYTFTLADNGTHTFSATSNDGGYNIITVEDVSDGSIAGGEGFTVSCPELVVTAGNNTGPICPGEQATLYVTSNQDNIVYQWAGPPRGTSYGSSDTIHVTRPGVYHVSGTSTANNCSTVTEIEVTSKSIAQPTLTPSATTVCGGGHASVTVNNAASFSGFVWSVVNATIISGQGTPTVEVQVFSAPNTSADVYVSTTDTTSGCAAEGETTFAIAPTFQPDIATATAACPNATQTASVADSGPGATYAWTITGGTITGGQGTRIIAWKPSGNGNVQLGITATTSSCTGADTATISVNGPTAQVSGDFALCAGEQATIPVVLAGTPPFSIVWNDGATQQNINTTSTSRAVTATESASYSIVQVTDASCNGIATGAASITVQDAPAIATQPKNASIQKGQTATLTVAAQGENLRYDWYRGNAGDRSHLVQSGASASYTTPTLDETTRYWVDVVSSCGATASRTTVVATSGRRRSSRH